MMDTRGLEFISDTILRLEGEENLVKLKEKGRGKKDKSKAGSLAVKPVKLVSLGLLLPLLVLMTLFVAVQIARRRRIKHLAFILGKSS